ncbi:hypothetical protein HG537_0B06760 [Torulaspora globosa]|uniref:3-oxoacyl-[acyl-carrier-protein] reductase n=1 Tax=Torulaspora globosa TaxID=48254 RepID=A0A7H9HNI3_9SACH|nr:hypothetical protein HG537_0B06760 [Torulaspora sp. CBS 2947]
MLLQGKIALVTGASTGVGEGIARVLLREGATVIVCSRDPQRIANTARKLDPSGEKVIPKTADVADAQSVQSLINDIEQSYGRLDCLVCNAGITGPHNVNITDMELQDWHDVIQTNVNGTFYTLKYALPLIEKSCGTVVNLSSTNGFVGVPGLASYTASKHAIIGITQSVALEYARRNVRINAVAPGYVATPRILSLPTETQQWMADQHPMKRMATVEEVGNTVAFLLSPLSSFTTGSVYTIDGGLLA